jgi:hypothetical protein
MKKNFIYALMSAIALTGAASFSACSSSDEIVDNPDYNPEDNSVKTQFTIAFPSEISGIATRQTSSVVQEGASTDLTKFLGISKMVLIPYANATDRATRLGEAIEVSSMIKPKEATSTNAIPNGTTLASGLVDKTTSVLYKDVTIPLSTSGFLFYGEATGTSDDFATGSIVETNLDNAHQATDFLFSLQPIKAEESNIDKTNSDKIIAYLTQIAAATHWADCANTANSSQSWYNAGLGELYKVFTSNHAGSTATVKGLVQDLYESVYSTPGDVATAIKTAITTTYANASGTTLTFTGDLGNNYPADNNLPDGSAAMTWSTASPAVPSMVYTGSTTDLNAGSMTSYTYPASLYYTVSSGIQTANASLAEKYTGSANWTTILGNYSAGTSVGPSTKSVAIVNPIEYAVARLDVGIYAEAETLYDREGTGVDVGSTTFPVTGVIVGGQPVSVNYLFQALNNAGGRTIYDKTMNSTFYATYSASPVSAQNHTLVLETFATQKVNVIIELENNSGSAFVGKTGIIPNNTKFYLAAELDPTTDGLSIPYTEKKVFKQDYITTAILKIAKGSAGSTNTTGLGAAYNIIPDLRTTQMELGMSVNLEWRSGITFDLEI